MKTCKIVWAPAAMAVALASSGALAADWSGPYLGVAMGLKDVTADWQTTATFAPSGTPIPPTSYAKAEFEDSDESVGLFAGYNWQLGSSWVIGAELDTHFFANEDKVTDRIPGLGMPGPVPPSSARVKVEDDVSLRFRGGYKVSDNWLLYGTLGWSQQDTEVTVTCPADTTVCNPAVGTQVFEGSETMDGWTVGLGVETVVADHWVFNAEYRYADYGQYDFTAIPPTISTFGANAELDVEAETFEARVAYKF